MMDGHAAHPARPMFDAYLQRWNLAPAGAPITTPAARLLPVLHEGQPAMLKISHEQDEREGGVLMRWWDGQGAARVLAHDDDAILLERATGTRSLAEYARNGRDDEATRIICDVLARLHAPRAKARRRCARWNPGSSTCGPWRRRKAASWPTAPATRAPCSTIRATRPCCMATCTTTTSWTSASAAGW